ncbi:MAG: hypothetical protein RML46_09675 [Anaerolineae bacterium]|nr:hypothetical protein [Anaerolineae bacterium]
MRQRPFLKQISQPLVWFLFLPLALLILYGVLYGLLTYLSGKPLCIRNIAVHLLEALSGGAILSAILAGFIGFGVEKWRKSVEAEKERTERLRNALQELEQLGQALDRRKYREGLSLYRLFRERCQREGIWRDIGILEDARSLWERKAPLPLQNWVALIEGIQKSELDLKTLEALVWGRLLDPDNWEKQGRALLKELITPDSLESLVSLFEKEPELWKSLLRIEIIGQRLKELEQITPEKQKSSLTTLQNWQKMPPLKMPPPWERVNRPPDPPEFTKWLQQFGFSQNPFGPEAAELDPLLAKYSHWPSMLEPVRGPRPALVLGAPGSGRTAAAIILYFKCLFPPGCPEEPGVFPVWLEIDAWPQNPEDWLWRIGRVLAEGLLRICGQDPYALFTTPEVSAAVAHLFTYYFGPADQVEFHLRRQGFPRSVVDYVMGEIGVYADRFSEKKADPVTLRDLIGRARPADLKATYIFIDVLAFRPADANPRVTSLATLMEITGLLTRQGVYLKLFLPEEAGKLLLDFWPTQPIFLKEWPQNDLREMLQRRLIWSSNGQVESLGIVCSREEYPPDPDTWLIQSAQGSPRHLVELGNQMLQTTWEKSLK